MKDVHESTHSVTAHINKPVEEVFDFITTPGDWTKWHPATASVTSKSSQPALEGEIIVENVKHGLLRDTFRWKVVECRAPKRWAILGTSDRFGQKVRIDYTLTPENGGTLWEREMCFYFPNHYKYMDRLVFSRILKRNSDKAVRQLKQYLEQ